MNDPHDDTIETLLRHEFDGPVTDDGFCHRVMQRLPTRRRRATWPLWVGALTGTAACWLSLFWAPLLHVGWRDLSGGTLSTPAIALLLTMACMTLLALGWALMEVDD